MDMVPEEGTNNRPRAPLFKITYCYYYMIVNGCSIIIDIVVVQCALNLSQRWYLLLAAVCP